jgi:hypothetical protein
MEVSSLWRKELKLPSLHWKGIVEAGERVGSWAKEWERMETATQMGKVATCLNGAMASHGQSRPGSPGAGAEVPLPRSADPPFHEPEPAIASEGWSSSQGL